MPAISIPLLIADRVFDALGPVLAQKRPDLAEISPEIKNEIKREVSAAVLRDPVVTNELNAEPAWRSRVVVGSGVAGAGGVFIAIGIVLTEFQAHGMAVHEWDWVTAGPALAAVYGAGYALYGRLRSGLRPLFS